MLDQKQLGAIHKAAKNAGLSDPEYRNLLFEVAGVTSAKFLSYEGFQAAMRAIGDRVYGPGRKSEKTPQDCKIWAVWLGGKGGPGICQYIPEQERTADYLFGFIRRRLGRSDVSKLSDLSVAEKRDVIDALRNRLAQEIAQANKQEPVPF